MPNLNHMTEINLAQRRDFGGVLNATFVFLKQESALFFKTLLTYTAIPIVASIALFAYVMTQAINGQIESIINSPDPSTVLMFIIPVVILWFLLIITQILVVALTNGYLKLYKEKGKGNFSVSEVGQIAARNFFPIIGYGIVVSIPIIVGFLLFILPGIYLAVTLNFILIIMFIEDKGLSKNFSRCFEVIRNNWWVTFGLLFVASIIINVVIQVFYIPMQVYLQMKMLTIAETGDLSQLNIPLVIITFVLLMVGGTYLQSFMYLVTGLQYFSLNEADGSTTILDRINKIGETPSSTENQF